MNKPWYKDGEVWAVLFWFIGIPLIAFLWNPVSSYVSSIPITCTDQPIAFETTTIDTPEILAKDSYTDPPGTDGVQQVCVGRNGSNHGTTVKLQPINAIRYNGIKQEQTTTVVPKYTQPSGGSICNDGTWSPSTGRGTCSWHGGVAY